MRAHVIVPPELIAEVDRLVGPRRRSEFFVEAVREKLARAELAAAAEAAAGSLGKDDIPEWETHDKVVRWVHQIRQEGTRTPEPIGEE